MSEEALESSIHIPFLRELQDITGLIRSQHWFSNNTNPSESSVDDIYLDIVKMVVNNSDLFKWIDDIIILEALKKWSLKINYLSPWNSIIKEWTSNCDSIYLLLCWELEVYKNSTKISQINWMWVVWEMAFLNKDLKRTATVKTSSGAYIIMLTQKFIENLGDKFMNKITKNLYAITSARLNEMNEKIARGEKNEDLGILSQKIQKEVSTVCIWN